MPCAPYAGCPVQRRAEVVVATAFRLTRSDAHAHWQLQRSLRVNRCIDCGARRGERGAHSVTGVLEQPSAPGFDGGAQHLVVRGQGHLHSVGLFLPSARRPLDIREEERDCPARCARRHRTPASSPAPCVVILATSPHTPAPAPRTPSPRTPHGPRTRTPCRSTTHALYPPPVSPRPPPSPRSATPGSPSRRRDRHLPRSARRR